MGGRQSSFSNGRGGRRHSNGDGELLKACHCRARLQDLVGSCDGSLKIDVGQVAFDGASVEDLVGEDEVMKMMTPFGFWVHSFQ